MFRGRVVVQFREGSANLSAEREAMTHPETPATSDHVENRDTRTGPRSVAVDLVRVVGVVAIVAAHNWGERPWAHPWFYTWHVPVFFVITGYLWKSDRRTSRELANRARTLLVPYVAWLVVVTLVMQGFLLTRGGMVTDGLLRAMVLGGSHLARPYSTFWFVTALFSAAVLMRFLQNRVAFLPWVVGGLGLAWAATDPAGLSAVPQSLGLALPALVFIGVGMVLRRHRERITDPLVVGAVLLVPALVLGGRGVFASLDMKIGVLGQPLVGVFMASAISCGAILVAEGTERWLPRWTRRVVTEVAQVSLPIIMAHTLVFALFEQSGVALSKWSFVVAYGAPLVLGLVLARTPARAIFLGR